MNGVRLKGSRIVLDADVWTDYWTCDVGFAAGIPVPDTYQGWWPPVTRHCRGVNSTFYTTCRRCGLPRGWEKRQRRP